MKALRTAALLAVCGAPSRSPVRSAGSFAGWRSAGTRPADGAPFDAPLAHTPLATPLAVTGGFCEYRIGHLHAGFDFGTGGSVGKPVMAPANGWVARIRSSGVGYGRSLYINTEDGRLLQLGHLDAFAGPVAAYVRAKQDSSGQYEQDLWPEAGASASAPGRRSRGAARAAPAARTCTSRSAAAT